MAELLSKTDFFNNKRTKFFLIFLFLSFRARLSHETDKISGVVLYYVVWQTTNYTSFTVL